MPDLLLSTVLTEGKEVKEYHGTAYVLEESIITDLAIVKIEGGKIGQQGLAAAGIKQPSSGRSLQKAGKTMLAAGRDGSANSVFTDDIELHSHLHEQTFKQTCLRV